MSLHKLCSSLSVACMSLLTVVHGWSAEPADSVKNLFSDDSEKRQLAHRTILATKESLSTEARTDLVHALVKGLEDNELDTRKEDAIRRAILILGELPEEEAIQALAARIAFPRVYPGPVRGFPIPHYPSSYEVSVSRMAAAPLRDSCPAVALLIKIGEPCLPAVISKIGTANVTEAIACQEVLAALKDKAPVVDMLKNAIAKETDTKKRARLQASLDQLTKSQ